MSREIWVLVFLQRNNQACHSLISEIGPTSEPGPVKAERRDRREQASRREALTGGSDGTQWVTREWQVRPRRCNLITPLALPLICSSAWFALLPFALLVSRVGSCLLEFSITSGCCHLFNDLLLAITGALGSSPGPQSPELGGTCILVFLLPLSIHPNSTIPHYSFVSVRPLSAGGSGCYCHWRRLAVQWFVYLARHPQVMQQHRQLPRHRHPCLLLSPFAPARH